MSIASIPKPPGPPPSPRHGQSHRLRHHQEKLIPRLYSVRKKTQPSTYRLHARINKAGSSCTPGKPAPSLIKGSGGQV
jgi:hypothetical protein